MRRDLIVGVLLVALLTTTGCGERSQPTTSAEEKGVPSPGDHSATNIVPQQAVAKEPASAATPKVPTNGLVPDDPEDRQIRELVDQLLAATGERESEFVERLKELGDKAIPALLRALVDGENCQPRILRQLHEHVGFQAPATPASFVIALATSGDTAVKYRLPAVLAATTHADLKVQLGAFRYLRQLGYVGDDRIAIADACWKSLQFNPNREVRSEALALRREQTALALSMINGNRLSFAMPILPQTADWLARLGTEAVRQGLAEPAASLRVANSLISTHDLDVQSLKLAAADARRNYFDQIRADVLENARERERAEYPHRPRYLAPVVPRGVNLPALNKYLAERSKAIAPLADAKIEAQGERDLADKQNAATAAELAIEILELTRDARLAEALAEEMEVDFSEAASPSILNNPALQSALQLAARHAQAGNNHQASFWAHEAVSGYRNWPTGVHVGYLNALLLAATSDMRLADLAHALADAQSAADALLVVGHYTNIQRQGASARQIRSQIDQLRSEILQQLGRPKEAEFYRGESARFLEPSPPDQTVRQALVAVEQGDAAYERGDYSSAVDSLLEARRILDPPNRDTLPIVIGLHLRLGYALCQTQRASEAWCVALQGCALSRYHFGDEARANAGMILLLGAAERDLGQFEEAEKTIEASRKIFLDGASSHTASDPLMLLNCDHHLGVLRVKQGRTEEGRALLARTLSERTKELGADHRLTLQTKQALEAAAANR